MAYRNPSIHKINKTTERNSSKKALSTPLTEKEMAYFRNKMVQYETEQETFKRKLEKYLNIANDRSSLELEMVHKNEKIQALQSALSLLQKYLFEERERSNNLQSEVDMLKIEEEENHQKIRVLLSMTSDENLRDNIIYVFQKPLGLQIGQRMFNTNYNEDEITKVKRLASVEATSNLADLRNSLQKQYESLQEVMKNQALLEGQRVEAMVKDCSISMKEAEKQNKEINDKLLKLINKLKQTEVDLKDTNAELLDTRKALRRQEMLRGIQRDILLKNIKSTANSISKSDTIRTTIDKMTKCVNKAFEGFDAMENDDNLVNSDVHEDNNTSSSHTDIKLTDNEDNIPYSNSVLGISNSGLNRNISRDQTNLKQEIHNEFQKHEHQEFQKHEHQEFQKHEHQEFQNHFNKIEKEETQFKDVESATPDKWKSYNKWLESQLKATKSKHQRLESYRRLEIEGFQTEIKLLTKKVRDMEKQLLKALHIIGRGEKDVKLLQNIHTATKNSLRVSDEVRQLKCKLYQLQNDLRVM